MLRLGPDGRPTGWSPAAEALLAGPGAGPGDLRLDGDQVRAADGRRFGLERYPLDDDDGWLALVGTAADVAAPLDDELTARFDASPLPQSRVGLDGAVLAVNLAMERLLGAPREALVGRDAVTLFAPDHREAVARALDRLNSGERSSDREEHPVLRADGTTVPVSVTAALVRDEQGRSVLACSVVDLTPQLAVEQAVSAGEARLRALLRQATDVVVVVDASGRLTYVSPAVAERLGYDEQALRGTRALDLNHPDDVADIVAAFSRVRSRPGAVEVFECRVRHADGSWRWTEQSYSNLLDDPDIAGVVVNLRDTTERRLAEQDLRRLAVHDTLTGLANRTLLLDRVEQALQRGRHSGEQAGLVLLDVRGMREHNDRLGHEGGDALLIVVADRLRAVAGPTASVARVGQDEFGVLVAGVTSAEEMRTRTAAVLDAAQEPLQIGGRDVLLELRAGFALTPADSAGALLAAAEGVVRSGSGAVRQGASSGDGTREALGRAVTAGQLRLHYQPVLRLADGSVEGVEALVRWEHPVRGLLAPAEFVPLAEASGLIVELGEWVLRAACHQLATWTAAGRRLTVGINLSPRQLAVPGFGDLLLAVLDETGVRPAQLVLEVTESAVMDDTRALQTLQGLHRLGVRLALDDFGTGYSSLTYLKRFPVDALKVDRSFVAGLGRDADDEAIVASVVSLARSVGRAVVAEGVETGGQLQLLRELGVDQAQGFLWSRPLPPEALEAWLDDHAPAVPAPAPAADVPAAPRLVDAVEARILALQGEGASLQTIAAALNDEGLSSFDGKRWHSRSVARVVAALGRPS